MDTKKIIAIIGLGYVGLPLAIEFAKHFRVIGFDISGSRVKSLNELVDLTHEANLDDLAQVLHPIGVGKGLRSLPI